MNQLATLEVLQVLQVVQLKAGDACSRSQLLFVESLPRDPCALADRRPAVPLWALCCKAPHLESSEGMVDL